MTVGQPVPAQDQAPAGQAQCVRIDVYVRKGSTQSDAAAAFLDGLSRRRAGVAVHFHDVQEPAADARARELLRAYRIEKPGLPVIHACNQLIVGYVDEETTGRRIEELLNIDVFVRKGCTHCAAAKTFLARIAGRYPGFTIRYHDIVEKPAERDRLLELANRYKVQVSNVPAVHGCGKLLIGYDRDATSGRRIEDVLRSACTPCLRVKTDPAIEQRQRSVTPPIPPALALWAFSAHQPDDGDSPEPPIDEAPLEDIPLEDLTADEASSGPVVRHEDVESTNIITLPVLGKVDVRKLGLPLFTIAIGLIDGFNPCAMWVLLFLLSILVNLQDRRKILAVAGTFVVISGLAYFAFMAAWLNVFMIVGVLRPAQIVLGLLAIFVGSVHVKDFFAFHKGLSLSIPESAKPGIYARVRRIVHAEHLTGAVLGAATLAVLVNIVELLCTAGLPALYTQALTLQELPVWQNYAYLLLYNLAYMADDALMVTLVVVTLGRRKLQERQGRWLKLVSGMAVLILGLVLIFRPEWLV